MKSFDPNFPLGNTLIVGLEGPILSELEKTLLNCIRPIGVIFFKRNFIEKEGWELEFRDLIKSIKEYSEGYTKVFSIDFEGGRVDRFPASTFKYPYARYYAESSYEVGSSMSSYLKTLGINLSYSPCLDVDLEPDNPVIGERSFSNNSSEVTKSGLNYYKAFEENNIITCAKHFPGHGRSKLDSHFDLPIIDASREELAVDLAPFIDLIRHKIPCVMAAHVLYPALDRESPASLSRPILTDLLRASLDFSGLIISDDFDMKALQVYPKKERYLKMLLAGTNCILLGNGMDGKALEDAARIFSDITQSDLTANLLEETSNKITDLISRYKLV